MMKDEIKQIGAGLGLVALLFLFGALAGCGTTPAAVARWAAPGGYEAVKRVEPMMYSSDPALRQTAIAALVKLGDYDAVNALATATLSPTPFVRGEVGAALLFNANEELDLYSITLLADPSAEVRRLMAVGLAAAGKAGPLANTERAGIYLWGLTQDVDPDVRAAAIEGVGSLGLSDPIDFALEALRHDAEPRVRAAAARGLGALARAYLAGESGPDLRDPAVDQFLNKLGTPRQPTPTQARGEEIVSALCQAARTDEGKYTEIRVEPGLFSTKRFEDTRLVAMAAADALMISGRTPRGDVAEAIAAARAHEPPPPPKPLVLPPKFHPGPL